jgi:O-antigen ligase
VGLTGVVLFFAFAGVRSSDAVSTRLNNTKNLQGRLAIYKVGFALFERSPAAGVGINRFVPAQVVLPGSLVRHAVIRFPHNSYLATLAEGGLLVFIPLVLATFYVWRLVAQFRRRAAMKDDELLAAVMAGCALSYLLVSLSLTILPYGPSNSLLALLLGTGAARLDQLTAERALLAELGTA